MFINGLLVRGDGPPLAVVNPATGEAIATLKGASLEQVRTAVEAAAAAGWAAFPAVERERILRESAALVRQRVEEAAAIIVAENGKLLAEARAETLAAAETLEFYAGEARRISGRGIPARSAEGRCSTLKQPVGVVAAFSPWNFPLINLVRKLAPALAAGCTVIAKPAEETPGSALLLAKVLMEAGVPAASVNIVFGDPTAISSLLIAHPMVRKISFTGSVSVGRRLAAQAGEYLKRTTMELGGSAPVIVCDDVDPAWAADLAATAKFRNAGQSCNSASRFFVQACIHDQFASRFVERARAIRVGDGMATGSTMGPVSNRRRLAALEGLVDDAVDHGAKVLVGGKPAPRAGFFFEPTVLTNTPSAARIMREEPFGPIAPIVSFDTLDEAIALANDVPVGLAGYVLTHDRGRAAMLTRRLRVGALGINTFTVALPEAPFGGVTDSGWGHEGGAEGIEPYLQTRFLHEA